MSFHDREDVFARLHVALDADDDLAAQLGASLVQAARRAEAELDPSLRDALDWPCDLDAYVDYLVRFARWVPQESAGPAWQDEAPRHRFAQEVSDRLAHFFWLVDQKVGGADGGAVERSARYREFLTDFAKDWGSFLDTPESFDSDVLASFRKNAPQYTIGESMVADVPNAPSGWQTFNQFFARQLNPGLRPISTPTDNTVITSPADCSYEHSFRIDDQSRIPATRIKKTATYGSVATLLDGSRHAEAFAGGTFTHYMLPPSAYHRFHVPVSGRVLESFVTHGQVYMQVDVRNGRLQSLDRTDSGYEFFQTRGVLVIDTSGSPHGDIGLVGVVPVGMSHVASVVMTAPVGVELSKGDEFGYFQFGGSDIILLLQHGAGLDIDESDGFRLVGSVAAELTVGK